MQSADALCQPVCVTVCMCVCGVVRTRLTDSLCLLTSHLSDVKTRARRLNAVRQSRQDELYTLQQRIRQHSEQIVARVREREATLLLEAQNKFDSLLSTDSHCNSLAELEFRKSEIEKLVGDVRQLLAGPPLSCLLYFDEVAANVCRLTDPSLHGATAAASSSTKPRTPCRPVRFVPASLSDVDIIIGSLQDCSFSSAADAADADEAAQSPSTTTSSPHSVSAADNHTSTSSTVGRKRTASILSAMSPVRSKHCDWRACRMKSVARLHQHQQPQQQQQWTWHGTAAGDVAAAASTVCRADRPACDSALVPTCSSVADSTAAAPAVTSAVTSSAVDSARASAAPANNVSVTVTLSTTAATAHQPRIVFAVDQVFYT